MKKKNQNIVINTEAVVEGLILKQVRKRNEMRKSCFAFVWRTWNAMSAGMAV